MRPEYLNHLFLTGNADMRIVLVRGEQVGFVERIVLSTGETYWRYEVGGKTYGTLLEAAESLAVRVLDGPLACATFDAERIKEQAK